MLEIVGNGGVWHRAKSGHPSITWKGPLRQAWSETDPFNPPTYFREEPKNIGAQQILSRPVFVTFSWNLAHDRLVLPYAMSGKKTSIANVRTDEVLAALKG
jgi:hypothetical protein